MGAFISLKVREGKTKSLFLVFGILGFLVTLLIFSASFSTNTSHDVSSDYVQYGFQWTSLSLLAAVGAVSLSSLSVDKHREGNFSDLISLHGLRKKDQYWGLLVANIFLSLQMAVVLILAMTLSLVVKQPDITVVSFLLATLNYLLAVTCVSMLITGLSFFLPPIPCNLLGLLMVILGSIQGTLDLIIGNLGGTYALVLRSLLKVMPPLSTFGQISRDLFFGEFSSWNTFLSCLFYLWILLGLVALVIKGVKK